MICRITVTGIVQGVGYRPFAARLAKELSIEGTVKNSGGSVLITASGKRGAVEEFIHRLTSQKPEGALILQVKAEELGEKPEGESETGSETEGPAAGAKTDHGFVIAESEKKAFTELPMLSPDLGVCGCCLEELNSAGNRRYRHALISCTSCGPRYSIMRTLPYDRDTTAMEAFSMCPACTAEYTGSGRRRHAQTISCHDCGPEIFFRKSLTEWDGEISEKKMGNAALCAAVEVLKRGGILAVKGLGGFQLLCMPKHEETVKRLRLMKGREKKPFALMFEHLSDILEICEVSAQEKALLTSPARPIVLLHKKKELFGTGVSGDSRYLGAFLPNTPLQSLILSETGPLIVTSCNRSSEPIMTKEDEVFAWNPSGLEGVLYHNREIFTPLDDSVAYVLNKKIHLIRRSRGYVPLPVLLSAADRTAPEIKSSVLAMGSDLKAVFGIFAGDRIVLSQYFGDMENLAISKAYEKELDRMGELLETKPAIVVCDLHPLYGTVCLAHRLAKEGKVQQVISVQHHHAHVASVMAEQGLVSCIGVAFDGTGYGTDKAVWGSEFLYCHGANMERKGHLAYVDFCGGDETSLDGSLALLCYRIAQGCQDKDIQDVRYPLVQAALKIGTGIVRSCSMGRLFDAVSALLHLRTVNTYEGECAIALENAAWTAIEKGIRPYPLYFFTEFWENKDERDMTEGEWMASATALIEEIRTAFENKGVSAGELALGFHHAVAQLVEELCCQIRRETGETKVALSGGVFANRLLSQLCTERLTEAGFAVYENEQIPCNDSGLALGQAYLTAFMTDNRREKSCV